jgi:hypothetical protein
MNQPSRQRSLRLIILFCSISLLGGICPAIGAGSNSVKQLQIPEKGAYTGAYCDFGDGEDGVTLEAIEKFQDLTGKSLALVAFGSFWARQEFPTEKVELVRSYGAVPLLFWSPWDDPFDQNRGPDRFSLNEILAGKWDAYIDKWATEAAKIPSQFFVSFACEMNGTWFPWSGEFYGKGPPTIGDVKDPSTWPGPETFKKAWRYVVDRARARGATNILWVFQPNNYSYPSIPWNLAAAYYPGPEYVDWLALSVYGKQYKDEDWAPFPPLLQWPYQELCKLDPRKPIMLAEWGVAESHKPTESKGAWVAGAFKDMSSNYPRLKAAIFWHERWQNEDDSYSNLRVNSSRGSLKAYKEGVANPFWLGRPEWRAR